MAELSADLKGLLTHTNLVVFPEDYFIVHLPVGIKAISGEWFRPATTRFAVVIQEPKVITMVLPRRKWLRMQRIFEKYDVIGPMKVISFDVKLSLVSSGYLSAIGSLLTESSIRSVPISAFRNDHIVVPKSDLPRTVRLLRNFFADGKKQMPGKPKNSHK
jgi:hypothetical protein